MIRLLFLSWPGVLIPTAMVSLTATAYMLDGWGEVVMMWAYALVVGGCFFAGDAAGNHFRRRRAKPDHTPTEKG